MKRASLLACVALAALVLGGCLPPATSGLRAVISTIPSPAQGEYPLTVTFDASRSTGPIVTYLWSFGDGSTGSGLTVSHTYADRGQYTVYLTVVAADGGSVEAQAVVLVQSKHPIAQFTFSPASGVKVNTPVAFDASASSDPDGTIAEYLWDFGDGSWTVTNAPTTQHTYTQPGQYTVALVVKDATGDTSAPSTRLLAVTQGGCCGN